MPSQATTAAQSVPSDPAFDRTRFLPGAMLAGRYRIHGLLGRGGMGEVYRADDLKLGQPVALKFLPRELNGDRERLNRFLGEIRLARQVSHPSVCRVYDVGETDGQHFLSMEYVDGEDLSSLLRRIGRLPKDKAAQIARQICAGLAAAHELGILHRDLKPANVMVDGRGRARITDFGLAGLEHEIAKTDVPAGTPAYMAPEQIAGAEVTVKSDIYALGLVLYEIFTGKRAFDAMTPADLRRQQTASTPASPSSLVEDLDPAAERVILRCLEKSPAGRPASALAVAAALPGGDPLAAALAAGETPSPELVAEAGGEGGLRPAVALACLAFIVAVTLLNVALRSRASMLGHLTLEKPPQVLAERARGIARDLGYTDSPVDTSYRFDFHQEYIRHLGDTDKSRTRWNALAAGQPPAVYFDYRESPRSLVPENPDGRVAWNDPPRLVSGMINVELDTRGRLRRLLVVPPQIDESADPPPDPGWLPLLAAAGYDPADLTRVESTWLPFDYADTRAAWTGVYPDNPDVAVRLEAGALRGKPVFFQTLEPWTRPWRMQPFENRPGEKVLQIVLLSLFIFCMAGAVLLARRNLRLGRGDRKGAYRVASVVFVVLTVIWTLTADHVPDLGGEIGMLVLSVSGSLFLAAVVWLMYVALEPFVRRRWPGALVSWNRLLAGRFKDPLVGRDILIGAVFQVAVDLLGSLVYLSPGWVGLPPPQPWLFHIDTLLGGRHLVAAMFQAGIGAVISPVVVLFFIVILRVALRKQSLAFAAFVLLLVTLNVLESPDTWIVSAPLTALIATIFVLMIVRFGLLTLGTGALLGQMWAIYPLTFDFSTWYASAAILPALAGFAIVLFAFYNALAGRPLLGDALAES